MDDLHLYWCDEFGAWCKCREMAQLEDCNKRIRESETKKFYDLIEKLRKELKVMNELLMEADND